MGQIWHRLGHQSDEVIMAVPEYFTQEQLGLILGMAKELSIPVKGLVPMALAASSKPDPGSALLFIDMHLHRSVITLLAQEDRLFQTDSETLPGHGLSQMFNQFANKVSREFIQQTRFDPFHRAASEQELYNRLPEILQGLQSNASTVFKMRAGAHMHQITIARKLFFKIIAPVFNRILRVMEEMQHRHGKTEAHSTIQVTHRAGAVFDFEEIRVKFPNARVIACEPGSAALGVLQLTDLFNSRINPQVDSQRKVPLLSSRPWLTGTAEVDENRNTTGELKLDPTHLLYQSVAYPITENRPLVVGMGRPPQRLHIYFKTDTSQSSQEYCSIKRRGESIFLMNHNNDIIQVDGKKVADTVRLSLGQYIRIGNIEESLQLIACENSHET
jgi:hypothetical protein